MLCIALPFLAMLTALGVCCCYCKDGSTHSYLNARVRLLSYDSIPTYIHPQLSGT